jgi:hypothetical protein
MTAHLCLGNIMVTYHRPTVDDDEGDATAVDDDEGDATVNSYKLYSMCKRCLGFYLTTGMTSHLDKTCRKKQLQGVGDTEEAIDLACGYTRLLEKMKTVATVRMGNSKEVYT